MANQTSNPQLDAELFKVESIHHIHGQQCLCGFQSAVSRDRTKHLMEVTIAALNVKELQADAWDSGFVSGKSRAMRHMSDEPSLPLSEPNPYRRDVVEDDQLRRIPTYPDCATCDGGGCGDCA
ncbi:hypothetical protein SEA_PEGGYLEG03_61 [Arthrobacter phage PeggyLeg03]|nr:hypothetical protein SEA_PEGGYLEG03_61 [Arthrobacter phage PeggyLeg03]